MQAALQTSNGRINNPCTKDWNNLDTKVQLCGANLVEMFRSLAQGMMQPGEAFDLKEPEQIPVACKYHAEAADTYREMGDIDSYFRHAQMAALLKKVEFPLFDEVCKQNAMKKWFAAEAACHEMNERCFDVLTHPHSTKHVELKVQLESMRAELTALLGERPPSLDTLAPLFGFGPGADSSHTRREGHAAFKLLMPSALAEQNIDVLDELCPQLMRFSGNPLGALLGDVNSVGVSYECARLEFVPKTCEEHRTIEIMPSLATFVAKGYDAFIRERLLRHWAIDLKHQEPNRHLAFLGSLQDGDDSPVTLDLKSASDRLSMGLIRLVLPVEWSKALFSLRSRNVILEDGTNHILEKFASMGNSLTFSLQTAIYGAIIVCAYRAAGLRWKKWRAYGDDLIVIKKVAPRVISDLERVGFALNTDKSFISGPFRESCGHDYFRGQYVRPFYIKKPVRTVRDVYKYINTLQIAAIRSPIPASSYRGLFHYLLSLVPKQFRLLGHPAYGLETCIWSPLVAVPKKILSEREVQMKVTEEVAYRVVLLSGGSDSIVEARKVALRTPSLEKERLFYTPTQLLEYKRRITLERSRRENFSRLQRTPAEIPSGVSIIVMRRPGQPGLSPLNDEEVARLLIPFWC